MIELATGKLNSGVGAIRMHDLTDFKLIDMALCSKALRNAGLNAGSMEEVANRIVTYLYKSTGSLKNGDSACALVRFFKTHAFGGLEPDLQRYALNLAGRKTLSDETRCMVLLATAGDRPEWNFRRSSLRHQAIPLPSPELVERMPMISQLVSQLGFDLPALLKPRVTMLMEPEERRYGVFYIPEASTSPYIPDQEAFVAPHRIKSVAGFGAMLPSGNMFAVILFAKTAIAQETARLFATLALSVKVAVVPFDGLRVFESMPPEAVPNER